MISLELILIATVRRIYDHSHDQRPFHIDPKEISVERLIGDQRKKLTTAVEGNVSTVLRYKGRECAVMSLCEPTKADWRILQVQGAKSRESFRITGSFGWQRYLADHISSYAHDSRANVRRISMPRLEDVTHSDRAATPVIASHYKHVREALQMVFSEGENLWIRDI